MQNKALRIAIDLTPLRPGGENGGAKILVLSLLKQFQTLAKRHHFLLLTSSSNHAELVEHQTINTTCELVLNNLAEPKTNHIVILEKIKNKLVAKLNLPIWNKKKFLKDRQIDLLFCPFSAPTYAEKNIPLVAIVYDLQHIEFPFFFTPAERQHRTMFLNDLAQKSQKLVCISDFTRKSFIEKLQMPADKLAVIPICIQDRLPTLTSSNVNTHLISLGIAARKYAFFPANYWQHKNHRFLLVAYGIYKKQFPHQSLDLVFTGALKDEERQLTVAASLMGLSENVHFLGFLNEEALAAVWQGSSCLIFPSLYEGFGIPVLEAMRFGKPVLCSNTGSLPEVGSDAVLYFNPRKLDEIVRCLAQVTNDEILVKQLVTKGYQRLEAFNSQEMADRYLRIFEAVALNKTRQFKL